MRWSNDTMDRLGRHALGTRSGAPRGLSVILYALVACGGAVESAPVPAQVAAEAAVSAAREAHARGDLVGARAAANRALLLVPGHAEALRVLRAATVQPIDPADRVALTQAASAASLEAACDDAHFLVLAGQERAAVDRLVAALAAHGEAATVALRQRAQAQLATARASEAQHEDRSAVQARADAIATANERTADNNRAVVNIRAERLARIRDLQHREHYELALANCRVLLHDLPGDSEVDALFRDLLEAAHGQRRDSLIERERALRAEILLQVERSLIPEGFDGRPIYPADWGSRRSGASNSLEIDAAPPLWLDHINDRLAQRITINLDAQPVPDAIAQITKLAGINILSAPDILAANDRLITLHAKQMRLSDVLSWITQQAATQWSVGNGTVYIGEHTESDRKLVIHDVGDLVMGTPSFPGPTMTFAGGPTGGASLLSPTAGGPAAGNTSPTADDLADLIKRTVNPAIWTLADVTIQVRGANLIVIAPERVQRLIREFLRAQTQQRNLAVHVNNRWLELTDTFIEEIGTQWNSAPSLPINTGLTPATGLLRSISGWQFSGGISNSTPSVSVSGAGAVGSGLTLQGAMLSGTQLSAVLTAIERTADSRVLEAPEICCLNGQRAHIRFTRQMAYISGYTVQGGNYDPTISVLNLGTILDVQPLVSADRKSVTMDIRATTSSATIFVENIITWTLLGTPVGGGVINTATYPLELPNVTLKTASTSVRLPDRGSLLIGGFSSDIDQFAAARVPLLGSIPFLGRLFGSRGRYNDRLKRYLLTTVSIINYPELEAQQ